MAGVASAAEHVPLTVVADASGGESGDQDDNVAELAKHMQVPDLLRREGWWVGATAARQGTTKVVARACNGPGPWKR
jgi:hypothetical protein